MEDFETLLARDDFAALDHRVVAEFRATGGQVGGPYAGVPLLLLHHVGARSGKPRVTPLVSLRSGDRLLLIAGKAGSDRHPAWYHNLLATPATTVELGDGTDVTTLSVVAEQVTAAERDHAFVLLTEVAPQFDYRHRTTREIPVLALRCAATDA